MISTKSGILQTSGFSSLAEKLKDNDGDQFFINFSQTDGTASGPTSTLLDPFVNWVNVTDTLMLSGSPGSDAGGISNSFVEGIPEPASMLLLGAGLTALGLVRHRQRH